VESDGIISGDSGAWAWARLRNDAGVIPFDERQLAHLLARPDLDHVELVGPDLRFRIDVVQAGQLFYWISYIAATDLKFDIAFTARAAMRSFPWTEPFKPKLERPQATLPVLCRWQRAYASDTAEQCVTLLTKHFRVPLETVQMSGGSFEGGLGPMEQSLTEPVPPPAGAAKQQKVWLREITAWYMRSR
jgi:hypothetical protein